MIRYTLDDSLFLSLSRSLSLSLALSLSPSLSITLSLSHSLSLSLSLTHSLSRDLVRSVTQMLMDMGKTVFTEDFERPFLDSSTQYYTMWTETRISACSTPEYLKNVDTRIQEEAERVKTCEILRKSRRCKDAVRE